MRFSAVSVVVVTFLLASHALARDLFVDNEAGDDRYSGHQARPMSDGTGPVRTIAKALRVAESGDRIILAATDTPYRESISLAGRQRSGYDWKPLMIEGNGAVLDGSAPVPKDAWQHFEGPVFRFHPSQGGHQQLFLDNRPPKRVPAPLDADKPPKLEPLEWCLLRGEIYFCVEKDKLPDDYNLSYAAKQTGITLYHVRHVIVRDLTVQGFRVDGINAANSARNVLLVGITARGNGRAGVAVGGASQLEIETSVLGNNGTAQILTLAHSEVAVGNSDLFSNTAPAWVDRGGRFFLDGKRLEGGLEEDITRLPTSNEAKPE